MTHLVLDGEDGAELEALTFRMMVETGATSELQARLARRLAIAFWKGERAERLEAALLAAATPTTFDVRRFNALRGAQAQIGREIRFCLAELRRLRDDPMACTDEPEGCVSEEQNCTNDLSSCTDGPGGSAQDEPGNGGRNEPNNPPPANDDVASPASAAPRNEPGRRLNRHQRRALAAMERRERRRVA